MGWKKKLKRKIAKVSPSHIVTKSVVGNDTYNKVADGIDKATDKVKNAGVAGGSIGRLIVGELLPKDMQDAWDAEGKALAKGDLKGFETAWKDKWGQIQGRESDIAESTRRTSEAEQSAAGGDLLGQYYNTALGGTAPVTSVGGSVSDPLTSGNLQGYNPNGSATSGATLWDSHKPYAMSPATIDGSALVGAMSPEKAKFGFDAENTLDNLAKVQQDYYDQVYRPVNRATIASIGAKVNERTAAGEVDNAGANRMLSRTLGMDARNAARFGVARGAVDANTAVKQTMGAFGKYRADTLSKARVADYDRDQQLIDSMINVGRGHEALSISNLTNAAQSESTINQTNANIDAQNDAARNQMVGTTVTALIAAMV